MKRWGLRWLVLLLVLAVATGVSAAFWIYLERTVPDFQTNAAVATLEVQARGLAMRLGTRTTDYDPEELGTLVRELDDATGSRFTVVLRDGEVLAESREEPVAMEDHSDRPELNAAWRTGQPARSIRYSYTRRTTMLYVAVPLLQDGEAFAAVRAARPYDEVLRPADRFLDRWQNFAVATLAVAAALAWWATGRLVRPVEALLVDASRFADGSLDHTFRVDGPKETADLADSLNRLTADLDLRLTRLQQQHHQLNAVLFSMEEGVLALDDQGVIINMNPAAGRMLELQPAVARGRSAHELVRKASLLEFLERAMGDPAPIVEDLNIVGANDLSLRAHSAPLVDADGKRIGLLVVMRDVTREQRLEGMQREFVANVSHELRTPITSIKGFAETLLDGALEDPETAQRFVETILQQTDRLSAVISDIISLSQIERDADEHRVELVPCPIAVLLHSAVDVCRSAASEKQIEIEVDAADDPTAMVSAGLLEQAVVNLLDNAIKYSEPGKNVRLEARQEERTVVIRVSDHGWGIEARHLPRLFDRFYRVDKGRSRSLGGTGLGLAIVKHIVLVHNGSVAVESQLGRGSTFSITLPAAEPTA